jgi:succinate dehydrogenase/fumarate reductase flavoprotein subunit
MSARRLELPVLIVGAGLAGLMAAIALARGGIDASAAAAHPPVRRRSERR